MISFITFSIVVSTINLVVAFFELRKIRTRCGYIPGDDLFIAIMCIMPITNIFVFLAFTIGFFAEKFSYRTRWFVKKVDKQ